MKLLISITIILGWLCSGLSANAQVPPTYTNNKAPDVNEEAYNVAAIQVKPEFNGGMDSFYKFISASFRVPEVDVENDINAKIFTTFVIEKDGTVSDIKIVRDPGYGLGNEAKRVIALSSGKWSPGVQNGKPVRTMYNLPFTIVIEGTGKKEEPAVKE